MTTSHTSQQAVTMCTSTLKKLVSVKVTKSCSVRQSGAADDFVMVLMCCVHMQ